MKKFIFGAILSVFALAVVVVPAFAAKSACTTIQSGDLLTSGGDVITTGYDEWGYNYQAYIFNGLYGNYSRPPVVVEDGDRLMMKWNDAWLSNKSCDSNLLLDRHYGYLTYKGSGAWLTNHMSGKYEDGTQWTYFVKIVAVPADAKNVSGVWYTTDDVKIGPAIWGDFAIVQEVSNDKNADQHGKQFLSDFGPGFGKY